MVSTTRRFESDGAGRGAGQQLGPASMDVNMAAVEPHRPQPIISTTERFKTHRDPTKNLGGTYRPSQYVKCAAHHRFLAAASSRCCVL